MSPFHPVRALTAAYGAPQSRLAPIGPRSSRTDLRLAARCGHRVWMEQGGVGTNADDFEYISATVPPGALFVAADEPLLVFPSVAAAERFLEATDVENGVYPAAYGPNGEPYRVASLGSRVIIERTGEPNRPAE